MSLINVIKQKDKISSVIDGDDKNKVMTCNYCGLLNRTTCKSR